MSNAGPVLLVEDSEDDVLLFRQAMTKTGVTLPLHVVSDGMEAVSYLAGSGAYSDRARYPVPSLILLDLKLPKKSGLEVLEWLRSDPSLQDIKVLVLTSSSEGTDVRRAYALGSALYIVKPIGHELLRNLVRGIQSYWSDLAGGPQKHLASFGIPHPRSSA